LKKVIFILKASHAICCVVTHDRRIGSRIQTERTYHPLGYVLVFFAAVNFRQSSSPQPGVDLKKTFLAEITDGTLEGSMLTDY
jgi:hypothetical protein